LLLKVKYKHASYGLLSLSSAVLMSLAWQNFYVLPSIFIGLVPLFILEKKIRAEQANSKLWVTLYTWFALLLWNIGSVWWIWNASPGGAIAAFIINSLPLVLPFLFYHNRNRKNGKENLLFFACLWILAEYLQFHWDLAFPWLILGNVFSYLPQLVQWYEITGVLGGSIWILALNIKFFQLYEAWEARTLNDQRGKWINALFFYVLMPVFASYYVQNLNVVPTQTPSAKFVVVQPNIDPYKDKFEGMSPDEQLRRMLQLAETVMDSQAQFILLPETALQGGLEENNLLQEGLFQLLHAFLKAHPGVTVVGGMDSYKLFAQKEKPAITSRKVRDTELWYNSYNAAFCTNGGDSIQVYHKSKLVPGVEKMPYPYLFGFIERYAIDLGGTSGSLSTDPESRNLGFSKHVQLAPIICYESVFGAYVSSYVNKGADVLCIITNDGWWGNTPGFRQHFDFGRLRAIENRRYLVRSANTGISAVIDEKGNVLQATEYWKEAAFKADVPLLRGQTYYAKNGDWVVGVMLVLLILSNIGSSFVLRKF